MSVSMGDDQQGAETTGPEFDLDFSNLGSSETGTQEQITEQHQGGDNPKWAPFLSDIPEFLHEKVKGHLKEWDRGVNERFQQINQEWAPFKAFRDQKVDPAILQQSYALTQQLQNDPVSVYAELDRYLTTRPEYRAILQERGLLRQVQQAAAVAAEAEGSEGIDTQDPIAMYQQLQKQIEERDRNIAEFFAAQEQERIAQQAYAEQTQQISDDFAAIEAQIKQTLPQEVKAEIVAKAITLGQMQGRPVSIPEAAAQVFQFMRTAGSALRKPAPRNIPTGGALPNVPETPAGQMTQEQKLAAAQAIASRFSGLAD